MDKSHKRILLLEGLVQRMNQVKGDLGRMEVYVYDQNAIKRIKIKLDELHGILEDMEQVNQEFRDGKL